MKKRPKRTRKNGAQVTSRIDAWATVVISGGRSFFGFSPVSPDGIKKRLWSIGIIDLREVVEISSQEVIRTERTSALEVPGGEPMRRIIEHTPVVHAVDHCPIPIRQMLIRADAVYFLIDLPEPIAYLYMMKAQEIARRGGPILSQLAEMMEQGMKKAEPRFQVIEPGKKEEEEETN